jgi:hypothetical protein
MAILATAEYTGTVQVVDGLKYCVVVAALADWILFPSRGARNNTQTMLKTSMARKMWWKRLDFIIHPSKNNRMVINQRKRFTKHDSIFVNL